MRTRRAQYKALSPATLYVYTCPVWAGRAHPLWHCMSCLSRIRFPLYPGHTSMKNLRSLLNPSESVSVPLRGASLRFSSMRFLKMRAGGDTLATNCKRPNRLCISRCVALCRPSHLVSTYLISPIFPSGILMDISRESNRMPREIIHCAGLHTFLVASTTPNSPIIVWSSSRAASALAKEASAPWSRLDRYPLLPWIYEVASVILCMNSADVLSPKRGHKSR